MVLRFHLVDQQRAGVLGRTGTHHRHGPRRVHGRRRRSPRVCCVAPLARNLRTSGLLMLSAEYGLTDYDELVHYYQTSYDAARQRFPEQVFTGGYYRTLDLGRHCGLWLGYAPAGRLRYAPLCACTLETIFQQSLHHYRAWADTSCEVVMCHDDMVWTSGPFVQSRILSRRDLSALQGSLGRGTHDAGKKVAFTSDGDWTMFSDDMCSRQGPTSWSLSRWSRWSTWSPAMARAIV